MRPILRAITHTRPFAPTILQKAISRPPLESPRQIGIIRNAIARLIRSGAVGIVLVAVVDAVPKSVLGDRIHRFVVRAEGQVADPGSWVWHEHVLVCAVVDAAVLDVGYAFCGDCEGSVGAVESGYTSRAARDWSRIGCRGGGIGRGWR